MLSEYFSLELETVDGQLCLHTSISLAENYTIAPVS